VNRNQLVKFLNKGTELCPRIPLKTLYSMTASQKTP